MRGRTVAGRVRSFEGGIYVRRRTTAGTRCWISRKQVSAKRGIVADEGRRTSRAQSCLSERQCWPARGDGRTKIPTDDPHISRRLDVEFEHCRASANVSDQVPYISRRLMSSRSKQPPNLARGTSRAWSSRAGRTRAGPSTTAQRGTRCLPRWKALPGHSKRGAAARTSSPARRRAGKRRQSAPA